MEKSGRLCAVRNEERTREGVSGWMSWSVSVLRDSVSWVWKGNQNSANQMYVDTYLLQVNLLTHLIIACTIGPRC